MLTSTWTLAGTVVAATTALALFGAGSVRGAPRTDQPGVGTARGNPALAPDRAAGPAVVPSPAATSALATLQGRIASYVSRHGTRYTFGSYVDSATGMIVLDTDAPTDLVSRLASVPAVAAQPRRATPLQVRRTTTADTLGRRDDAAPFWAGGGLLSGGNICSSGYAVRNSAGTVSMVTAGHCYATGATVLTESGARTYGVVSSRRLPTITGQPQDLALIGGQSYAGRVFTGAATSSSSIPVVAAGTAYVGYNAYCHSGRTTGEQCGHTATSVTGQVCTATGCKSPVIVYTGGTIQQGGDSGGTFYAKDGTGAWIRGHVIASNATTGYVEPWTVVSPALGVSIVTG